MSATQAEAFANTYAVVDQFTDPFTGFSGTVFDRGGVKYFAIRGTETGVFSGAIDWLTNVADVGSEGIAVRQGVALFNWLQRLYGAPGQAVVQYTYDPDTRLIGTTTGIASGLLAGQPPLTVTGHSLGGHLAMIMSRLAPDLVSAVTTFNAPGFDTNLRTNLFPLTSDGFFNLLRNAAIGPVTGAIGTVWDDSLMTHFEVEGDVAHGIGNTPGIQNENVIFSESANQGPVDAHSIVDLTDALALYDLFARIDAGLNTAEPAVGIGRITAILNTAANTPGNSLEAALDALRVLFKDPGIPDVAPTATGDRDAFYANLNNTDFRNRISGYTGLLSIEQLLDKDAATLEANAFDEIGWRYALKALDPFVVLGEEGLYAPHNGNGALEVYDPVTGAGALTARWIEDRARFLELKLDLNTMDQAFGLTSGTDSIWYEDRARVGGVDVEQNVYVLSSGLLGTRGLKNPRLLESVLGKSDAQRYIFGSGGGRRRDPRGR